MTSSAEQLRRGVLAIAREALATRRALPGEHELARRLGSNRAQIRRVLALLEQQGIVVRHQGASTSVDPIALRMTVRLEEQREHSELLERLGYEPAVELMTQTLARLGPDRAAELARGEDEIALRVRKRWTASGQPAMLADNTLVLPAGTGEHLDGAVSAFEMIAVLWGEPVVWEVATPGVEVLDAVTAPLLGLPPGAACMTLTIVGTLRSGARVFHSFERHHPELVQYSVVRRLPEPWT